MYKVSDILNVIKDKTSGILDSKERVLIAIDGRCAAGKTTTAQALGKDLGCRVLHMDDFFLRPCQRTPERLKTPGGNVDHERFLEEVLLPLSQGKKYIYRPYICRTGDFGAATEHTPTQITVIEGSYSCHPALREYYDLTVFLDIDPNIQIERITARNGAQAAETFKNKWIPLEELYFGTFDIAEACDLKF